MKHWLASPPSRRGIAVGMLLVGLTLLGALTGSGLAGKDGEAATKGRYKQLTTLAASAGCQTATGTGAAAGGAIGAGGGGLLSRCPGGILLGGLIGAGTGALAGSAVDANRADNAQRAANAQAADAVARAPSPEQLRDMTQSAVPPPQIVEMIRASGVVYRLTPEQITWLNQQGVDQSVIKALQDTALRPYPGRVAYTAPPVVVEQPVYAGPSPVTRIAKERLRYEGKSFEQWREQLFIDLSPKTLAEAMLAMGAFGCKGYGPEAAEAILRRMGDYDPECDEDLLRNVSEQQHFMEAACYSLLKIGPPALLALQNGLQDNNGNIRIFALKALREFEDKAKDAIPALLHAIKHGDVKERVAAIKAMSAIDNTDRGFIAALIDALKNKETEVRRAASCQLRCLVDAYRHRCLAWDSLMPALSALAGALRDRDAGVREDVVLALKDLVNDLGPMAKDAVPGLIEALKSKECNELHEVVEMLAKIGPDAKDAVPVLTQLLKTPPPKIRYHKLGEDCLEGYTLEGAFQCRVYDTLEKITGTKPSSPRPQRAESRNPF